MSSGPGVGAAVAVAGGSETGASLGATDAAALADGEGLGDPNRQPASSTTESGSPKRARRRMRAA
jgi:hypothetical protein